MSRLDLYPRKTLTVSGKHGPGCCGQPLRRQPMCTYRQPPSERQVLRMCLDPWPPRTLNSPGHRCRPRQPLNTYQHPAWGRRRAVLGSKPSGAGSFSLSLELNLCRCLRQLTSEPTEACNPLKLRLPPERRLAGLEESHAKAQVVLTRVGVCGRLRVRPKPCSLLEHGRRASYMPIWIYCGTPHWAPRL